MMNNIETAISNLQTICPFDLSGTTIDVAVGLVVAYLFIIIWAYMFLR